ncbi:hypothetical protein BROUX41_002622 [Berkeleyomyces rouxiae]|uniref:uncharacterized protein n=1 Tax=Berkeleyomyces rouxiae TaxID=2035830 RepID=UPI003B81C998
MPRRLPAGWDRPVTPEPKKQVKEEESDLPPLLDDSQAAPDSGSQRKRPRVNGQDVALSDSECKPAGSSSPAKISEKIAEVYMIEGLDNDDQYCMVEDELYETAKRFTAHLHDAEYQRLRNEVRSLNASDAKNIARPVVGSMTDTAKRVGTQSGRLQMLRKATDKNRVRNAADNDDDALLDAALAETPLGQLMQFGWAKQDSPINKNWKTRGDRPAVSSRSSPQGSRQRDIRTSGQQAVTEAPTPASPERQSPLDLKKSEPPSLESQSSLPLVSFATEASLSRLPSAVFSTTPSSRSRFSILSDDENDGYSSAPAPCPPPLHETTPQPVKISLMSGSLRRTKTSPIRKVSSPPRRPSMEEEQRPESASETHEGSDSDDIFLQMRRKRRAKTLERKSCAVLRRGCTGRQPQP